MADQRDRPGPPPVGSVAEEAARLLDALGGWVSTNGYAAAPDAGEPAAEPTDSEPTDSEPADPGPAVPGGRDETAGHEGGAGPEQPPSETGRHGAGHCEHCGAANGAGQAVTCQWCPLCQGIGLLRSVRPETVERLADLAGALATALRDVATHTRTTAGAPHGPSAPHDAKARSTRVQDITIDDEDQGSATR